MIDLRVHPRTVVEWGKFLLEGEPYSIALDGYVRGPPRYDSRGPCASFNHHEGVDRLGTRATTGQVYVAIKQALFDTFQVDGERTAILHVNDCDQDVCVAVWLFQNAERFVGVRSEPLLTRLIGVTDLLDTTAGAYPLDPSASIMRELAWIHEPYTAMRTACALPDLDAEGMSSIIGAVCERISRYTIGKGGKVALDTRYVELGGGAGWALIREDGAHARSALFARGVRAFVAYSERHDGNATVSIGKMSPYVAFPLDEIFAHLNSVEGISRDSLDMWGGGDTIGGSPREAGTALTPAELEREINAVLARG